MIHDVLGPLYWLIGPSGLLNMRLPLLSDLAGQTITIKDLIPVLDPEDGPIIVTFINAIEQLDYISGLVAQAGSDAKGGGLMLNFGSLAISNPGNVTDKTFGQSLSLGSVLGPGQSLGSMSSLSKVQLPNLSGKSLGTSGAGSSATSSFMSGIGDGSDSTSSKGSLSFPILQAS